MVVECPSLMGYSLRTKKDCKEILLFSIIMLLVIALVWLL